MLFPSRERDIEIATRHMTSYEFLARCQREDCARVRALLESWYDNYPDEEKAELKARLSADETNFRSAFWELYLHELLLGLGYEVEIHPTLSTDEPTQPDFLATGSSGKELIVEAVSASKKAEQGASASRRRKTVLDKIDELDHPDFYVGLEEKGYPRTSPSGRRIRDSIQRWLDGLDYDEAIKILDLGRIESLPTKEFSAEGWELKFQAIPKSRQRRGSETGRLIHLHHTGVQWIDSRTPIRDAILRKATKYGDIQLPYVVAVNSTDPFTGDIDVAEALFGKEVMQYNMDPNTSGQAKLGRVPDGAWTSKAGERNTRVSGVLIGCGLYPSNVASRNLDLYHNPWAQRECKGPITQLIQHVPEDGKMKEIGGIHPRTILGLPELWPGTAE